MNGKYTFGLLVLTMLLFLAACNTEPAQNSDEKEAQISSERAPYEQSPLASLMRVMEAHADAVRDSLRTDGSLPSFPEGIKTITTATPTEDMHLDSMSFPIFAKDYQNKVAELYAVEQGDRHAAYNNLVRSCASCHKSHCPGPLMKIEKMYIE